MNRILHRPGLRARFFVACALLVLTTVTASLWILTTLSQLSGVIGTALRDSDETTAATAALAGALEREDDALLLLLAGAGHAREGLADAQRRVDDTLARLTRLLAQRPEQDLAEQLRRGIGTYRAAAAAVAATAGEPDALLRYSHEANPLLRDAVAYTGEIRDQHFEQTQRVAALARDEALRARRVVLAITAVALLVSVLVARHLARVVIAPLRQLTREARAIRRGEFDARMPVDSDDELGQLATAFNEMAADLAEFRRTNLGEVLRAKATLEATIEALPDAVVVTDAAGRVRSMNASAQRLIRAERRPERLADLGIDGLDDAAVADVPSRPPIADLRGALRIEHDGTTRRLLPRIIPVPGFGDGHAGALVLLSDVTDLARLDEMRAELVAVASHELQTPLTTLRMTLLMLQENAAGLTPRQRELVDASLGGIDQLAEIVGEFLDLARIEAGELRLNREPVDAAALVTACVRRVHTHAREAGIDVHVSMGEALPPVSGDRTRLRVVIDNVLSNALKYTPAGGRVTVGVHGAGRNGDTGRIAIAIADTGPGIPEELRRRVFEKFFRVEHLRPELETGTRGTGVGLYLCDQIVALHGGTIRCEPAAPHSGTRFVIELPVERASAS